MNGKHAGARTDTWLVLPAFNEAENIGNLLSRAALAFRDAGLPPPIVVVVDDGSSDGTVAAVQAFDELSDIRIFSHAVNQGLGPTLRDGLREAAAAARPGDVIVTMDADDTHHPGLIPAMLQKIREGFDVVIASRYRPDSRIVGLNFSRRWMSIGAAWIFRILHPIKGVRDYTCGFRAYRAEMIQTAFAHYGEGFVDKQGFQCMVDVLLKLRRLQPRPLMVEVPFVLRYDRKGGASKMKIVKTIIQTLRVAIYGQ
ncbi:MAG: glycosyltransferase [Saprospiraceae bacterium]|nr:glycosyltransferase [Saprospiraceae bacterium]